MAGVEKRRPCRVRGCDAQAAQVNRALDADTGSDGSTAQDRANAAGFKGVVATGGYQALELVRSLAKGSDDVPDAPGELADAVTALRLATAIGRVLEPGESR